MSDWNVRGLDFETYLVGPITDMIIDADRHASRYVRNGFPNWILYRTFLCGDHHLRVQARDWCVAYAIAAAESGVVRQGMPVEELGVLAGWDAYSRLMDGEWLITQADVVDVAEVKPDTYRKLRNYVYASLKAALDWYFVELQVAIRRVWKDCRSMPVQAHALTWRPADSALDSAFDGAGSAMTDGNGNYLKIILR